MKDLRAFLAVLQREGELVTIDKPVDPVLEIAAIHRETVASNGPALLFNNVKGSRFPVTTNLFGSQKRIELAFPQRPEQLLRELLSMLHEPPTIPSLWRRRHLLKPLLQLGTTRTRRAPVLANHIAPPDLEQLPILKCWPRDGGHFVTLPLVYTEPPHGGPSNLGMYRIQRFGKTTTGLHFQIAKGGGYHYHQAEQAGKALPVSIFLGGPPALIMAAIAPLPENIPEMLLASFLAGGKIRTARHAASPYPLIADAEFALVGHAAPFERAMEGPFGDHYGYYGLAHEYPVFRCEALFHREGAVYPATVVGKPVQEDLYIGNFLQRFFAPVLSLVMPAVKGLWSYGEAGFHPLTAVRLNERYEREALTTAFRILGEGQLSLTKWLLLTDAPVACDDIRAVLEAVLARCNPRTDLQVLCATANDTLDYTGPRINHGSKAIFLGCGAPKRVLPAEWKGTLPAPVGHAVPFCKGCLLVDAPWPWADYSAITSHPACAEWPLIVLVDDARKAASTLEFLWQLGTRSDPATDLHPRGAVLEKHHVQYAMPFLIDARMKPHYPPEVP